MTKVFDQRHLKSVRPLTVAASSQSVFVNYFSSPFDYNADQIWRTAHNVQRGRSDMSCIQHSLQLQYKDCRINFQEWMWQNVLYICRYLDFFLFVPLCLYTYLGNFSQESDLPLNFMCKWKEIPHCLSGTKYVKDTSSQIWRINIWNGSTFIPSWVSSLEFSLVPLFTKINLSKRGQLQTITLSFEMTPLKL